MYSDLQSDVVEFLELEEDFFGLPILPDAPPNTQATVDDWLKEKGACMVIGRPRQTRNGASEVGVQVPIMFFESDIINNSSNGVAMDGNQAVTNLIVCLDGYQTQPFWTPFNVRPFTPKDAEYGITPMGCMLETKTLIAREFAILVTHTGAAICDHNENGKAILTTNRGKQY
jgi:hypothetical protein